jgi:glycosyltransferase involved in cell wall biosynthesis
MKQSDKINVMHVSLALDIGGLERLITQMALAMDRSIFNVEIVTLNRAGVFADELRSKGIPVTLLQKNQQRADYFYPVRLAKFLRSRNTHVLHMHTGVFIFGELAATLARTPASLYTEHGRALVDDPVRNAEDRIAVKLVDRIVAVSSNLRDILIERIGAPTKKLEVLINGIATDLFDRRPKSQALIDEFGIDKNTKIIGTVARLDAIKDQMTMIKAVELLLADGLDCRLFLVGDGPEREQLTAYIHQQQLEKKVTITGTRTDVPDFLNLFDLFVLSSLSEGTSISLLEAMASGVPPVVTRVGGNPAVVTDGTDGLVIDPGDPRRLADAMGKILQDPDLGRRFSDSSIAKVRRDYSIHRMVRSYSEIYLDILHRKGKFKNIGVGNLSGKS